MKKFYCCALLCLLFTFNPLVAIAQEDGWRYLKWGMSIEEVKNAISKNKECVGKLREVVGSNFFLTYARGEDKDAQWSSFPPPKIIYLLSDGSFVDAVKLEFVYPPGDDVPHRCPDTLYMFNGKLFGVAVSFGEVMLNRVYENFLNQLKEKYPKGRIIRPVNKKNTPTGALLPYFEYTSDKITIFMAEFEQLFFYEPKTLNEVVNSIRKANETMKEKEKNESLKGKF